MREPILPGFLISVIVDARPPLLGGLASQCLKIPGTEFVDDGYEEHYGGLP
jgi:hypothetical protein